MRCSTADLILSLTRCGSFWNLVVSIEEKMCFNDQLCNNFTIGSPHYTTTRLSDSEFRGPRRGHSISNKCHTSCSRTLFAKKLAAARSQSTIRSQSIDTKLTQTAVDRRVWWETAASVRPIFHLSPSQMSHTVKMRQLFV